MKKQKEKFNLLAQATAFEVVGVSKRTGELLADTKSREENPSRSKIIIIDNRRIRPALEVGDSFIGKIQERGGMWYVKAIARSARANAPVEKIYGIVEKLNHQAYVKPADKGSRTTYLLDNPDSVKNGDFVAITLNGSKRFKQAVIVKNYGTYNINKAAAGSILDKYNINPVFPEAVIKELKSLEQWHKDGREDLTKLPLVTIDGDDSKDFDDAVWAQKTVTGFNLIVAIADVAFYVRHLSALDREAYRRGNSVYLPNMVIPMLPELLSNDLCSLRPKEVRPVLACYMTIDHDGKLTGFNFKRAYMRSAARLTYKEVQEAFDGKKNAHTAPLMKTVIQPLYEAYQALRQARLKRGALELDIKEIKVKVDDQGVIKSAAPAEVYDSNRLIEEFMVAANVAAARCLQKHKLPIMYRVHDKPKAEKLQEIEPLLHSLKLKLPDLPNLKAGNLNKIIEKCQDTGYAAGIHDLILRLQSQACYSPYNIGHFGLALRDYAHFTSPIRRYADILIHRALIKVCKMPDGGGLDDTADDKLFAEIGEHISTTERAAVAAEREVTERYLSAYLEPLCGQDFEVRVTGLTTAGVFVRIESLGAEGLVPMRTLPDDDYMLMQGGAEMLGRFSGRTFKMGENITCRLVEAVPLTGGLSFKYVDPQEGTDYFVKGLRGNGKKPVRSQSSEGKKSKAGKNKKKAKKEKKKDKKRKKKHA